MNFIIIYITHTNMEEAKKIGEKLLQDKLIACVNYLPIKSAYWWKGEIANTGEIVSLVKTRTENWDKVRTAVEAIHPYETPCIMKLDVTANQAYVDWILAETK